MLTETTTMLVIVRWYWWYHDADVSDDGCNDHSNGNNGDCDDNRRWSRIVIINDNNGDCDDNDDQW